MKPRTGLGKKVSSIFNSVSIPGAGRDSTAPQMDAGNQGLMRENQPLSGSAHGGIPPQGPKSGSIRTKYGDVTLRLQQQLFGSQTETGQTRQKVAIVAMVVCFIILVLVIYYYDIAPANKSAAKPVQTPAIAIASASAAAPVKWKEPQPYPDILRDPMLMAGQARIISVGGAGAASQTPVAVSLRGIVFSADKPAAIVNGQVAYEGKTIDGVTVVKINKHSVDFKFKNKTWTQGLEK